jgi:predicted DNA-binding helix-hairpin-helix protein
MIEPNIADEKELMRLPHLNPALVKGIVERRPFANMMDLHKFLSQSLDAKQLSELYTKMFIQMNLNTATREEIMLIPGMGNRMVREFLEYRPYTASHSLQRDWQICRRQRSCPVGTVCVRPHQRQLSNR